MAAPLVVVDRLTKSYGRATVLHAVSLTIRRGEVLGLIGPNGAGKTTLFQCEGHQRRREAPRLAEVRYTSAMDDLVLLWIPFGLMIIVASVALMFVVMRLLA